VSCAHGLYVSGDRLSGRGAAETLETMVAGRRRFIMVRSRGRGHRDRWRIIRRVPFGHDYLRPESITIKCRLTNYLV